MPLLYSLPRSYLVVDYETRGTKDLKKVDPYTYSMDPTTEPMCLGYRFIDWGREYDIGLWEPGDFIPTQWLESVERELPIFAFNVFFERSITENIMGPRYNWPIPKHAQWRDIAASCYSLALPSKLVDICKVLKIDEQKDMEGHKLMLSMCKPTKKGGWVESDEDKQRLYEYCRQDIATEHDLLKTVGDIYPGEYPVFNTDQHINWRGIYCDTETVGSAIKLFKKYSKRETARLNFLTNYEIKTVNQTQKIRDHLKERFDLDLPGLDKAIVKDTLARDDVPTEAKKILEIRQALGRSSVKKYQRMLDSADEHQRIRGHLIYCGAGTTGRWAGQGFQGQNMTKADLAEGDEGNVEIEVFIDAVNRGDTVWINTMYGNIVKAMSWFVRSMLQASPGHELFVIDYASIEARVLAWFAGQKDLIQVFVDGLDPYIVMATTIYGVPYDQVTPFQRWVGKQAILGLGYQMWWPKFQAQCARYGVEISDDLAEKTVVTYRRKMYKIKNLWKDLDTIAKTAIRNPGMVCKCGKVTFRYEKGFLFCKLPSGRKLAYFGAHIVEEEDNWGRMKEVIRYWGYKSKEGGSKVWMLLTTYGGKFAENIVQGMARDILAAALVRFEQSHKYKTVLHTHDEIVAECPTGTGDMDEVTQLFEELGDEYEGLPIASEGWKGQFYRK